MLFLVPLGGPKSDPQGLRKPTETPTTSWLKYQVHIAFQIMERKGCGVLIVHALDDALFLESGEFCDSGMKCLGVVLHYLAAFLCKETTWKLACTDEYAALRLRTGTVERDGLAAVLLRIRLEQVSAMDCFKELIRWVKFRNRWLDGPSFRFLVHELAGVFQKGLKLHERSLRLSLRYNRDRHRTGGIWVCQPESYSYLYKVTPVPHYVESTWHNVGILMVTREQHVKRCRRKTSHSFSHQSFLPESQTNHLPSSTCRGSAYDVYNRL